MFRNQSPFLFLPYVSDSSPFIISIIKISGHIDSQLNSLLDYFHSSSIRLHLNHDGKHQPLRALSDLISLYVYQITKNSA
jgi:hypothetical protein